MPSRDTSKLVLSDAECSMILLAERMASRVFQSKRIDTNVILDAEYRYVARLRANGSLQASGRGSTPGFALAQLLLDLDEREHPEAQ